MIVWMDFMLQTANKNLRNTRIKSYVDPVRSKWYDVICSFLGNSWALITDVSELTVGSIFIHLSMKMEPTVSSETSAIRTQMPGNYPKRYELHLEHGESLKT